MIDNKYYKLITDHGCTAFVGWEPSLENMSKYKVKILFNKKVEKPIIVRIKCDEDPLVASTADTSSIQVIYDMRNIDDYIEMWCQECYLGLIDRCSDKKSHNYGYYVLEANPQLQICQVAGGDVVIEARVDVWEGSPYIDVNEELNYR